MVRAPMTTAALLLGAWAPGVANAAGANPIRKVVTLLQNMQTKVTEEGKKEQELFDAFMCYCKTSGGTLEKSIEEAKAKIEADSAAVKGASELKAQLEGDLKEHKAGRDEAKKTMAEAKALREKEADAFKASKAESETNINAIKKAVAALEKGAGTAFLQSASATSVRSYVMEKADLPDDSRQEVLAFLSNTEEGGYAPASGEITGILKQLGDEMAASLADATKDEATAQKNYDELMAAKGKEVETLQAQIEDKSARLGDIGVEVAETMNDIEDTKEALAADQKFVKELEEGCGTKEQEWEEVKKLRAEELLALADTIRVLNDDDALDLFSKTLPKPSASLIQLKVSASAVKSHALAIVRRAAHHRHSPALDLIALALSGKKVGFDKVISMIDAMSENLKKEQDADDSKRSYCQGEIDKAEDTNKELELSIKDSETAMDKLAGDIEKLTAEVAELDAGIKELDKSVAEATVQRKKENAEYKDLMASDSTAKEVLLWAKNRLNKFYNPKLYKAPPAAEMSEEDRVATNMGVGDAAAPAGGIAGTGIGAALVQVRAHTQHRAAPPPPPETFGPYSKKSGESAGAVEMIDLLVKDLDKEMQEAEVVEKDAQADYEKMTADASAKRTEDSKLITEKTSAKATAEESLQAEKDKKADTTKSLLDAVEVLRTLHGECDWLLKNFDARKEARAGEVEALANAKAVLSGADYSLLQAGPARHFLARRQ